MDLAAQLLATQIAAKEEAAAPNAVEYLVAPLPETIQDDGVLQFTQVVTLADVVKTPARHVLMFAHESYPLLKVLAENQKVLGYSLKALVGLPTAEYDVAFDEAVWPLEKIAYAPLVSEIMLTAEAEAQSKASKESDFNRETARYTRSDGSVKPMRATVAAAMDAENDDFAE